MPAPPIPAIQKRRPSSGEGKKLLGDLISRVGSRELQHRARHLRQPLVVVEQRANHLGRARDLVLRHDDRSTPGLEVTPILRLVIPRREEPWNEHRGLPRSSKLPDRAPRTCKRKIGGTERRRELLGEREEPVVGPAYSRTQPVVVACAGKMQHRGTAFTEDADRQLVEEGRAK